MNKNNGISYHKRNCRRLRFERPLSVGDASTRFSPCPVCRPLQAVEIVQASTAVESEAQPASEPGGFRRAFGKLGKTLLGLLAEAGPALGYMAPP